VYKLTRVLLIINGYNHVFNEYHVFNENHVFTFTDGQRKQRKTKRSHFWYFVVSMCNT